MSALTQPWIGRGVIASTGELSSTTGSITTTQTAYSAASNVKAVTLAGRRYRVTLVIPVLSSVAGDLIQVNILDGGGSAPVNGDPIVRGGRRGVDVANFTEELSVIHPDWQPTAGTHRLGVFGIRQNGTGTVTLGSATAGLLTLLTVEDIGLAP